MACFSHLQQFSDACDRFLYYALSGGFVTIAGLQHGRGGYYTLLMSLLVASRDDDDFGVPCAEFDSITGFDGRAADEIGTVERDWNVLNIP